MSQSIRGQLLWFKGECLLDGYDALTRGARFIEYARCISTTHLNAFGVLKPRAPRVWVVEWYDDENKLVCDAILGIDHARKRVSLSYYLVDLESGALYTKRGPKTSRASPMKFEFSLVTAYGNHGGHRKYFKCSCGSRVANLLMPIGKYKFGCKNCHGLIHLSRSGHRSALLLAPANDVRMTPRKDKRGDPPPLHRPNVCEAWLTSGLRKGNKCVSKDHALEMELAVVAHDELQKLARMTGWKSEEEDGISFGDVFRSRRRRTS